MEMTDEKLKLYDTKVKQISVLLVKVTDCKEFIKKINETKRTADGSGYFNLCIESEKSHPIKVDKFISNDILGASLDLIKTSAEKRLAELEKELENLMDVK